MKFIIYLAVLLLSACGGGENITSSPVTMPSPPRQLSVSCLGDSETAGMIDTGAINSSYSYCNKLSMPHPEGNPYKVNVVHNYATPSKDITQVYNEQLPSLLANPTNVVVIMVGVNDSYHHIPIEVYKQKYSSILSLVKAHNIIPVCLTTFPTHNELGIDTTEYDNHILTLSSQGCTVLDVKPLYKNSWGTSLHPTEQGYKDVSKALMDVLYML